MATRHGQAAATVTRVGSRSGTPAITVATPAASSATAATIGPANAARPAGQGGFGALGAQGLGCCGRWHDGPDRTRSPPGTARRLGPEGYPKALSGQTCRRDGPATLGVVMDGHGAQREPDAESYFTGRDAWFTEGGDATRPPPRPPRHRRSRRSASRPARSPSTRRPTCWSSAAARPARRRRSRRGASGSGSPSSSATAISAASPPAAS